LKPDGTSAGLFWRRTAHLFAYYTADSYVNTGCYDYDCGAFVQVSGNQFLGVALSPVSVSGGEQDELTILWGWFDGNWSLAVDGTWVGYYPGQLYGGGDMATNSDAIAFGGEYVCVPGMTDAYCPSPMGSGCLGAFGYPYAAYQRQIWYFDGAYNVNPGTGLNSFVNDCIGATSTIGPYCDGVGDFGVYFFFGGPGGYC
jgi:hypothetical protein